MNLVEVMVGVKGWGMCGSEVWLCNAITALFNLSERDLSHFHNHHPSSQDSSYYSAGEPAVPHNEARSAWDAARPPPTLSRVLSRAVHNSTLIGMVTRVRTRG